MLHFLLQILQHQPYCQLLIGKVFLQSYLLEAKKEALSASPSWSKIVGALVIVAAVTSGLADAPGAAKTIKDAIEYVLGTSVIKPLQNYLPAPNEPYAPPPRNMA